MNSLLFTYSVGTRLRDCCPKCRHSLPAWVSLSISCWSGMDMKLTTHFEKKSPAPDKRLEQQGHHSGSWLCLCFLIFGLKPSLQFLLINRQCTEEPFFCPIDIIWSRFFATESLRFSLNPINLPVRPLNFLSRNLILYQDPVLITKTVEINEESEGLPYS